MSFLVASFTATYRATSLATRAIRLYRHFKKNIGGSRLRSEVNRYTSSASSFIILQGINLVSVRTEDEGERYLFGHVCTAFSGRWNIATGETIGRERMTFEGGSFSKKLDGFGLAWHTGWSRFSTKCMYKHVKRNTNWFSGFNYRKSIRNVTAVLRRFWRDWLYPSSG